MKLRGKMISPPGNGLESQQPAKELHKWYTCGVKGWEGKRVLGMGSSTILFKLLYVHMESKPVKRPDAK